MAGAVRKCWLNERRQFFPAELGNIDWLLEELRTRLIARIEYWKSEALTYLNQQAEDQNARVLSSKPAVSPPSEQSKRSASRPLLIKYQSGLKRAILVELTKEPNATDLGVCRALDAEGSVELPKSWRRAPEDRQFRKAYMDKFIKRKIEKAISKVRGDLRKQGLMAER